MLEDYLRRHRSWCLATFGAGRKTKALTNHIRSELVEIEAEPEKLEEWLDVLGLALHGAWRTGASVSDVIAGLEAKHHINRHRLWIVSQHEDEPMEHDRSA